MFNLWVGKIPRRRKWQPTLVFLSGESHGQRSLVGYSPWGSQESAMTEQLNRTNPQWDRIFKDISKINNSQKGEALIQDWCQQEWCFYREEENGSPCHHLQPSVSTQRWQNAARVSGQASRRGRIPCQVWIPLPPTSSPVSHKTPARGGVSNLRMTFQSTASTRGLSHFEGRTASPLVRGVREGRVRLFWFKPLLV